MNKLTAGLSLATCIVIAAGVAALPPQVRGAARMDAAIAGARTPADRYLGPDRDRAFADFRDFITSVQSISTDGLARLGAPWETALENGRRRFREARSVEDVYYALLSVQRALRDGHARFMRGELPVAFGPAVELDLEVAVRYAGPAGGAHEYVVTRSGEPSVPVGSAITACDGAPVADLEAGLLEWYDRHTPEGFREFVARNLSFRKPQSLPCPAPGDTVRLAWRSPGGATGIAVLAWRAAPAGRGGSLDDNGSSAGSRTPPGQREPGRFDADYRALPLEASGLFYDLHGTRDPGTKVLRYVSFNYVDESDFPPEIAAIARHLRDTGARRVLVDVRENGGGAFDPALVGVFTSRPFNIMFKSFHFGSRLKAHPEAIGGDPGLELWTGDEARILREALAANPAATWAPPIPFFCLTADCSPAEATRQYDGSPGYDTVVLCGPGTFSSGDMFVTIMKDNGIARLAGMPSGAGDAPYRWALDYPLADGTRVRLRLTTAVSYRPNSAGIIIEGNPPPLDIPLYPTRGNAGAIVEAALEAAWGIRDAAPAGDTGR